jgi:hypothetical protein
MISDADLRAALRYELSLFLGDLNLTQELVEIVTRFANGSVGGIHASLRLSPFLLRIDKSAFQTLDLFTVEFILERAGGLLLRCVKRVKPLRGVSEQRLQAYQPMLAAVFVCQDRGRVRGAAACYGATRGSVVALEYGHLAACIRHMLLEARNQLARFTISELGVVESLL